MRRCRRRRTISSLSSRAISKISALCLVALCLLPFSAPFKVFDLGSSHGERSTTSVAKDKVDSDDEWVSAPDESLVPPHLMFVVVAPFTRPSQLEQHSLSSMALRL